MRIGGGPLRERHLSGIFKILQCAAHKVTLSFCRFKFIGNSNRIVVPRLGVLSIFKLPFTSATRSHMPNNPSDLGFRSSSGDKPMPLSSTTRRKVLSHTHAHT